MHEFLILSTLLRPESKCPEQGYFDEFDIQSATILMVPLAISPLYFNLIFSIMQLKQNLRI